MWVHEMSLAIIKQIGRGRMQVPGMTLWAREAHLYLVDDHGLVGKVHDRFGHRQRQGAQTCAIATHENEGLHCWGSAEA